MTPILSRPRIPDTIIGNDLWIADESAPAAVTKVLDVVLRHFEGVCSKGTWRVCKEVEC
jgi:hypothetical protein